jgi:hypothetical protein
MRGIHRDGFPGISIAGIWISTLLAPWEIPTGDKLSLTKFFKNLCGAKTRLEVSLLVEARSERYKTPSSPKVQHDHENGPGPFFGCPFPFSAGFLLSIGRKTIRTGQCLAGQASSPLPIGQLLELPLLFLQGLFGVLEGPRAFGDVAFESWCLEGLGVATAADSARVSFP